MNETNDDRGVAPSDRCPVCKSPVAGKDVPSFPFCSARCRQIDLGRWMDERYVVSRPIEQADLDASD